MGKTIGKVLEVASIAAFAYVTVGVGLGVAAGATVGASVSSLAAGIGLSTSALSGLALAGFADVAGLGGSTGQKPESTVVALKPRRREEAETGEPHRGTGRLLPPGSAAAWVEGDLVSRADFGRARSWAVDELFEPDRRALPGAQRA